MDKKKLTCVNVFILTSIAVSFVSQLHAENSEVAKKPERGEELHALISQLSEDPNSCELNRKVMYSHFDLGEVDIGLSYYKILAQLDCPSFSITREALKLISKEMDEAQLKAFCNEYLKLNPEDIILNERLAKILMAEQEWEKAETHLLRLLERIPENTKGSGGILLNLGTCRFNQNDYEQSLEYMQKAKNVGYDVPEVFFSILEAKIDN